MRLPSADFESAMSTIPSFRRNSVYNGDEIVRQGLLPTDRNYNKIIAILKQVFGVKIREFTHQGIWSILQQEW